MSDVTNVIKQFIRNKNHKTIGILVAFKHNDVPHVGWSLCHKNDKFNREFGETLAINRAIKSKATCIPNSIFTQFDIFHARAKRYFKLQSIGTELNIKI